MRLHIDPSRLHLPETGYFFPAVDERGRRLNVDLAHLTKDSAELVLRKPGWAQLIALGLLGHPLDKTKKPHYLGGIN